MAPRRIGGRISGWTNRLGSSTAVVVQNRSNNVPAPTDTNIDSVRPAILMPVSLKSVKCRVLRVLTLSNVSSSSPTEAPPGIDGEVLTSVFSDDKESIKPPTKGS